VHEEPGEEIVGIEQLLSGTLRSFVPIARDGPFNKRLAPIDGT
jgi:hypothetical protein